MEKKCLTIAVKHGNIMNVVMGRHPGHACGCGGMADAQDSKSCGGDLVWVQVPPSAVVKSVGNLDFIEVSPFFVTGIIGYSWLHFSISLSECPFKIRLLLPHRHRHSLNGIPDNMIGFIPLYRGQNLYITPFCIIPTPPITKNRPSCNGSACLFMGVIQFELPCITLYSMNEEIKWIGNS